MCVVANPYFSMCRSTLDTDTSYQNNNIRFKSSAQIYWGFDFLCFVPPMWFPSNVIWSHNMCFEFLQLSLTSGWFPLIPFDSLWVPSISMICFELFGYPLTLWLPLISFDPSMSMLFCCFLWVPSLLVNVCRFPVADRRLFTFGICYLVAFWNSTPAKYTSAKLQMWHTGNFQAPATPNTTIVQVTFWQRFYTVYFEELWQKSVWGKWYGAMHRIWLHGMSVRVLLA